MTVVHRYSAYGLTVNSNRPLDGFAPFQGQSQSITIDFAGTMPDFESFGEPFFRNGIETCWHLGEHVWVIRYVDSRDGSAWAMTLDQAAITIGWSRDGFLPDAVSVLLGAGLAAALHLRGIPVLHAAAVAVGDHAVLIMGMPGAGKSTTSAAFLRAGFPLMSDDVATLSMKSDSIEVEAGYPRLRVFAEAGRAAGWLGELPRQFSDESLGDKRYIGLEGGAFCAKALPLSAVYVLQRRDERATEARMEPVAQRVAPAVLMQNIYCARFLDRARHSRMLSACARIGATTPVRAVTAANDLASLPGLVDAIAADTLALASGATR